MAVEKAVNFEQGQQRLWQEKPITDRHKRIIIEQPNAELFVAEPTPSKILKCFFIFLLSE
jgi:hypothetical protein